MVYLFALPSVTLYGAPTTQGAPCCQVLVQGRGSASVALKEGGMLVLLLPPELGDHGCIIWVSKPQFRLCASGSWRMWVLRALPVFKLLQVRRSVTLELHEREGRVLLKE